MNRLSARYFLGKMMVQAGGAIAATFLVLLVFRGFTGHYDRQYYDQVTLTNHFWKMVAGTELADRSQLGKFAVDLRGYQGLPVAPNAQRWVVNSYYCKPDFYPGLKNDFQNALFIEGDGGFMQPAFQVDLERFPKMGAVPLLRTHVVAPVPLAQSDVDNCNTAIDNYNHLWKMVAGTEQVDSSPEGRLAVDLKGFVKDGAEKSVEPISKLPT